jgi:hypothetical protein
MCVVFCILLFVLLFFFCWRLSVLPFTVSDYLFGIFKPFLKVTCL